MHRPETTCSTHFCVSASMAWAWSWSGLRTVVVQQPWRNLAPSNLKWFMILLIISSQWYYVYPVHSRAEARWIFHSTLANKGDVALEKRFLSKAFELNTILKERGSVGGLWSFLTMQTGLKVFRIRQPSWKRLWRYISYEHILINIYSTLEWCTKFKVTWKWLQKLNKHGIFLEWACLLDFSLFKEQQNIHSSTKLVGLWIDTLILIWTGSI